MFHAVRSPRFSVLALAAFLLAQPVVGCAALCLLERHHAEHEMTGMGGGVVSGRGACHTGITDADQHHPAQTLSPMEPALEPVLAAAPVSSVEPLTALPALPPQVSRSVEPPPPRIV
jgi:hypothetical protein